MGPRRKTSQTLLAGLAAALALTVAEPIASAHGPKRATKHASTRWRPPAKLPLVSVSVESAHGHALPAVRHRGRNFVAGESGDRYEIRVTNNSASRLEVVVSVDGLDAVSGRPGSFSERGYVLEPFGSVAIDGFRTSLDRVAAFRFSSVGDSFAAATGAPQNAGVIGVAVFKERPARVVRRHRAAPGAAPKTEPLRKSAGRTSTTRGADAPSRELGTRFGESRDSAVREVSFTRASARRPDFRTVIHYDSARGLMARGVPMVVERPPIEPVPADAWPGARSDRFAQPPPGWTGRR